MYLFENISKENLNEYLAELQLGGFTLSDSYESGDNSFATLADGEYTICTDWFNGELRVVFDPFTAPVKLSDECEAKVPTVLWQHEVDHTLIDCGMCYIIQCADGSFFIMDSGHFFQMNDNDRIHRFLRERTPQGEKIRIAGWFLTHAHSDHVCKFADFLRFNSDDCIIEGIYYNFVPVEHPDKNYWGEDSYRIRSGIDRLMKEYSHIPQIKLHTGQRFSVRNLHFTVLCTHEATVPAELKDFNDTSTVLMMEAEGTKVLLTGDASDVESEIMVRRWGKQLECDILQVAHHGHHGCSKEFYENARGKVALFSNTRIFFDIELEAQGDTNKTILKLADTYRVSSEGTTQITLPYTGTECISDMPDETLEDFDFINRLWGYEYSEEFKNAAYEAFLSRGGNKKMHYLFNIPNQQTGGKPEVN